MMPTRCLKKFFYDAEQLSNRHCNRTFIVRSKMLSAVRQKGSSRSTLQLLQRYCAVSSPPSLLPEKCCKLQRSYASCFVLEELEGDEQRSTAPVSLAKSLACLPDEPSPHDPRRERTRAELKRLIELRIKKRVKAQFSNGKFYDLLNKVIAQVDTLQDSYNIIRLNSNVDLASESDDLCFSSMAEQLSSENFDIGANASEINAKSGNKECLVMPKLRLRIIQEAIRVALEVVFRPHFSKISHGCRSGRGRRSALNYVCREIHNSDWWFKLHPTNEIDDRILSQLIACMKEKLEDGRLLAFICRMFDARVVNLVFGGFPKGHGFPQEGPLSPILMNIYLDVFDRKVFLLSMRYEGYNPVFGAAKDAQGSKLRNWVRRQMKDHDVQLDKGEGLRLYVCRFMDEILVLVSGSKEIALKVKLEMVNWLKDSLFLDVHEQDGVVNVKDNPRGLQFLGTVIRLIRKESEAVRAVHKLKDKVRLFASQKHEIWNSLTVRIGKKWLAHGLRRTKESEIKALKLSTPLLDHISQFRKDGMKTDHWFKSLIKIWMQDVKANVEDNEEVVLSRYIAEPALPQDLRESFYNFQKHALDYISSETASTVALQTNSQTESEVLVTRVEAPTSYIVKSLYRYGLINMEGFPKYVSALALQDDDLIICWFSGLVQRWIKWYSEFDNFDKSKLIIVECARKSCIRTLAAKYRIHESLIEKKFNLELSQIPLTVEFETETITNVDDNCEESLMYGISYSGLCMLSLSRVKVPSRVFNCFVVGCATASPSMYTLHVMERQRYPGWITGFSTSLHPSLNGKRIGLCSRHVKDLYLGHISLQSIEFGALIR